MRATAAITTVIRQEKNRRNSSGSLAGSPCGNFPVATLQEAERQHILRALRQTGWRIAGPRGAASLLGVKRTTLQARIRKLGIRRPL